MRGIGGFVCGVLISWLMIVWYQYKSVKDDLALAKKNIEILKGNVKTYQSQVSECEHRKNVGMEVMKKRLDLEKKVNRDENTSVSIDADRFYLK